MSRRAATTITSICGGTPSVAATPPTTRWSITAWSSGIGICSWAEKRTAASSSAGSSIAGRRRVRTTTRWLAMPSRTCLRSLLLGEELTQGLGDAGGVGDLAVVEGLGGERRGRGSSHAGGAVAAHLGRADAAGLDLEADHGRLLAARSLQRARFSEAS